jgi:hypothetical protein
MCFCELMEGSLAVRRNFCMQASAHKMWLHTFGLVRCRRRRIRGRIGGSFLIAMPLTVFRAVRTIYTKFGARLRRIRGHDSTLLSGLCERNHLQGELAFDAQVGVLICWFFSLIEVVLIAALAQNGWAYPLSSSRHRFDFPRPRTCIAEQGGPERVGEDG